jgi:hypothetical protein
MFCYRIGDQDDYHEVETIDEVASALRDAGISEFDVIRGGVTADGYVGNNYVSLYRTTGNYKHDHDLLSHEISELRFRLTSR